MEETFTGYIYFYRVPTLTTLITSEYSAQAWIVTNEQPFEIIHDCGIQWLTRLSTTYLEVLKVSASVARLVLYINCI